MNPISLGGAAALSTAERREQQLWVAAQKLEASFLAEMLKSAGFGDQREEFGGGTGEAQFGSFLRNAQADLMVQKGGIGLAQALFDSLKERGAGDV